MINAKELRIGNYVEDRFHINDIQLRQLELDDFATMLNWGPFFNCYHPIHLTPEWLVDHGFECKEHKNSFFRGEEGTTMGYKISQDLILIPNRIRDASGNYDGFVVVDGRGITIRMQLIHFVHQLQNVCLDFTGEELTIKESA